MNEILSDELYLSTIECYKTDEIGLIPKKLKKNKRAYIT